MIESAHCEDNSRQQAFITPIISFSLFTWDANQLVFWWAQLVSWWLLWFLYFVENITPVRLFMGQADFQTRAWGEWCSCLLAHQGKNLYSMKHLFCLKSSRSMWRTELPEETESSWDKARTPLCARERDLEAQSQHGLTSKLEKWRRQRCSQGCRHPVLVTEIIKLHDNDSNDDKNQMWNLRIYFLCKISPP